MMKTLQQYILKFRLTGVIVVQLLKDNRLLLIEAKFGQNIKTLFKI